MKNQIIYLGIALVTFGNVTLASNLREVKRVENETAKGKEVIEDTLILNPSAIFASYQKTAEDRIAENNSITENNNNEVRPLTIERTIEDRIADDNQVIESTAPEAYTLDFKRINRDLNQIKLANNKKTIVYNSL